MPKLIHALLMLIAQATERDSEKEQVRTGRRTE